MEMSDMAERNRLFDQLEIIEKAMKINESGTKEDMASYLKEKKFFIERKLYQDIRPPKD